MMLEVVALRSVRVSERWLSSFIARLGYNAGTDKCSALLPCLNISTIPNIIVVPIDRALAMLTRSNADHG